MNTAEYVIDKFGGLSATAKALGHTNATTVQGWKMRGIIPARQQPLLLEAAKKLRISLKPEDFFRKAG